LAGVTASVGVVPDWVTVTLTEVAPGAETVIVATLEFVVVLAVKVAIMVPSPVPEGVTVHQAALLVVDQVVFEVTAKVVFPAGALTF
jgi:hypothetical protein